MAEDLMAGYAAYTSPQDVVAESVAAGVASPDEESLSVTISVTYSISWTWTVSA